MSETNEKQTSAVESTDVSHKKNGRLRCLLGIGIPLAIFGLIGFLAYYFSQDDGNKESSTSNNPASNSSKNDTNNEIELDLFKNEDPYIDSTTNHAWSNGDDGKNGLKLTILNALDPQWYLTFDEAVSNWDIGTPDVLTLVTKIATSTDTKCTPIAKFVKVCNGDYGKTYWKGINKVLLDDDQLIYASTAKMNEYYLPNKTSTQWERLYTMCHELGHSFGLGHSNNNFDNLNHDGNCMDYTTHYKDFSRPDNSTFDALKRLYGLVSNNTTKSTITDDDASAVYDDQYDDTTGTDDEATATTTTKTKTVAPTEMKTTAPTATVIPVTDDGIDDSVLQEDSPNNSQQQSNKTNSNQRLLVLPSTSTREGYNRNNNDVQQIPNWILDASKEIDNLFGAKLNTNTLHQRSLLQNHPGWRLLYENEFVQRHHFHIGNGYSIQVHLLLS